MRLEALKLYQFKNCDSADLEFHEHVNLIVGNNGMGKTNLLDAIYFMSFCKSYFQSQDKYSVQHDKDGFRIEGSYSTRDEENALNVSVKMALGQRKEITRNGNPYERYSDHIGSIPLIMITPNDISTIIEGSDTRRRLLDTMLCQVDKEYFKELIQYNRLLKQRNSYLKQTDYYHIDHAILDSYDHQMLHKNKLISEKRAIAISTLEPLIQEIYSDISGSSESVSIQYESKILDGDPFTALQDARADDIRLRRTTFGIHKDDFSMLIDGYPAKRFGSQGQIKSFVISLKLSQHIYLTDRSDTQVILLLDDIFDKLDDSRVEQLLEIATSERFGQVFISDTSADRVSHILNAKKIDYYCYHIQQGSVTKQ